MYVILPGIFEKPEAFTCGKRRLYTINVDAASATDGRWDEDPQCQEDVR